MWFQDLLRWLLFPSGLQGDQGGADVPPPFPQIVSVKSTVPLGIARIVRGTYAGTGAAQSIAVGFAPQMVIISTDNANGGVPFSYPQPGTGVVLTATGFDLSVGGGTYQNVNGRTYGWTAYAGAT